MDDVDHVRAQPVARRIHAGDDAVVGPVGDAVHAVAHLGGEHELVAAPREVPADALLGQAIGARRVDEREAEVERVIEDPRRGLLGQARVAGLHGAEAEHGHREPGVSERPPLHAAARQRSGRRNTAASGGSARRRRKG